MSRGWPGWRILKGLMTLSLYPLHRGGRRLDTNFRDVIDVAAWIIASYRTTSASMDLSRGLQFSASFQGSQASQPAVLSHVNTYLAWLCDAHAGMLRCLGHANDTA